MAAENKILNNAIVKIGNAQSEEHRLTVYHSDNTSVSIYGYGLYMSRTNSYIRPSNDGSQILAIGTDNNTWNYVALDTNYFTVSTNASEHFRITNTGNVGIGTTSPNYKLDVNGEAQLGYINFEYSSNYAGVRWKDSGYNLRWKIGNDGPSGNWLYLYDYAMSSSAFTFKPNSDMLFTPGGNVGIGTTSPNSKLHVSDTTDISMSGGSAGQVAIEGNGYTGAIALDATAMHIYHNSGARDLVLGTNETARLTISGSSGNVGIGTASPSEKLSVAGNIALVSNNSFISFNTSASSGDPKIQMGSDGDFSFLNTAGSTNLHIENAGNVGIGTTSPGYKLDVADSARIHGVRIGRDFSISDRATVRIDSNGDSPSDILFGHTAAANQSSWTGVHWAISARNSGVNPAEGDKFTIWRGPGHASPNNSENQFLTITPDLKMGIGTTSPGVKLHVNGGSVRAEGNATDQFFFEGVRTGVGTTIRIYDNANTAYIDSYNNMAFRANQNGGSGGSFRFTGGNVGIGTTSPDAKLNVSTSSLWGTAVTDAITIDNTGSAGDVNSEHSLGRIRWRTNGVIGASIDAIRDTPGAGHNVDIAFSTNTGGSGTSTVERMRINYNGNVGIGTTSPSNKLHVNIPGNDVAFRASRNNGTDGDLEISFSSAITAYNSKVNGHRWLENGSEKMRLNAGKLGIGTTSPSEKLEVTGNAILDASNARLKIKGGAAGTNSGIDWTFNTDSSQYAKIELDYNTRATTGLLIDSGYPMTLDYSSGRFNVKKNGTSELTILNGNVGIGTTNPSRKLHVSSGDILVDQSVARVSLGAQGSTGDVHFGSSGIGSAPPSGSQDYGFYAAHNAYRVSTGAWKHSRASVIPAVRLLGSAGVSQGNQGFSFDYSANVGTADITWTNLMQILPTGNVGIGTTSPSQKLDVNGDIIINDTSDPTLYMRRNDGTPVSAIMLDTSTDNIIIGATNMDELIFRDDSGEGMRLDGNGNLGIGTTSPGAKLDVRTSSDHIAEFITTTADSLAYIRVQNNVQSSTDTNTAAAAIELVGKADASGHGRHVWIGAEGVNNTDYRTKLKFKVRNGANDFDWSGTYEGPTIMTLDGNGNVGIGTTSPGQKLHVVGNVKFDGSRDIDFDTTDGNIRITPNTGGWATGYLFNGSAGTNRGGFGGFGSTNALTYYWIGDGYNDTTMVVQPNAGNVGIGTTSPASKLHVQSGAGIFNVSDDWHQSTYRTHLFRGGGFNSSISEESTAVKIFNGSAVDGKAVGNYWGGIAFMHLDPEYSSWGTSYTGEHFWIGGRLIDTPGQERSALVFATNNLTTSGSHSSEKMVILPNGNVGIGTTSPGAKLTIVSGGKGIHVDKGGHSSTSASLSECRTNYGFAYDTLRNGSTTGFFITNVGTNTPAMQAVDSSNNAQNISIQPYGGNVGIGTTSPSRKLHVSTGNGDTAAKFENTSSNGTVLHLQTTGDNKSMYFQTDHIYVSSGAMHFGNNTGDLYLKPSTSGGVGIGTTSPGAKLDVTTNHQAQTAIRVTHNNYNDYVLLKRRSDDTQKLGIKEENSNGSMGLFTADTTRVTITSAGNVGIGTTSPAQKLDVNGDIAVKGASVINKASAALTIGDTAGTDSVTSLNLTTAGRNTEVFLDDAGNVGINTATPSYNLTVDSGTNDIGILTASSDSGSYVGFLDNSTSTIPKIGAVGNKLILDASQYVGIKRTDPSYALDVSGTIRATGDVIAYSDARVKENVETIPNALDKVKAMRGVGYNKIGEERRSIGVIAQEMLEVMPEAVHKDDSGMYSVAYGNLVGVLIEAMKDQQAQIDELKARLNGSTK